MSKILNNYAPFREIEEFETVDIPTDSLISFKLEKGSDRNIIGNLFINNEEFLMPDREGLIIDEFVYNNEGKGFNLFIKVKDRKFLVETNPMKMLQEGDFINLMTKKRLENFNQTKGKYKEQKSVSYKIDNQEKRPIKINVSYNSNAPVTVNNNNEGEELRSVSDYVFDTGLKKV